MKNTLANDYPTLDDVQRNGSYREYYTYLYSRGVNNVSDDVKRVLLDQIAVNELGSRVLWKLRCILTLKLGESYVSEYAHNANTTTYSADELSTNSRSRGVSFLRQNNSQFSAPDDLISNSAKGVIKFRNHDLRSSTPEELGISNIKQFTTEIRQNTAKNEGIQNIAA